MDIKNIALFQAMGAKMDYLSLKQSTISQNIANSDTPEYRAREITDVDFGAVLQHITQDKKIRVHKTDPNHMLPGGNMDDPDLRKSRMTYEVAPGDNAVIIEEQMVNAARTTLDYNLVTNLMSKNVGMIRIALGTGQGR